MDMVIRGIEAQEGVIKYNPDKDTEGVHYVIGPSLRESEIQDLNLWRRIFFLHDFIGHDPQRYDGAAHGNVSQQVPPWNAPRLGRAFIITRTQTGDLEHLTANDYVTVLKYDPALNFVQRIGPPLDGGKPYKASSEAMTHGAVYDCDPSILFVFHAHTPFIWKYARELEIPTTHPDIPYGTREMAEEAQRLFRETDVRKKGIFSMGGHLDGIITFGETADETGYRMIQYLLMAQQLPLFDRKP